METFTRSEVAFVLGMPEAKVKNWTIGRPLKLTPSVRTARGTGTRNLYDLGDVYTMGLANELSKAGVSLDLVDFIIRKVKEALHEERKKSGSNTHLALGYDDCLASIKNLEIKLGDRQITIVIKGRHISPPGLVIVEKYAVSSYVEVQYKVLVGAIISNIIGKTLELRVDDFEVS
jgi:hypothetical protein